MTVETLNNLPLKQLRFELCKCCGSSKWVNKMTRCLPFADFEQLNKCAQDCWATCTEIDWLEAFSYHPRIGEKDIEQKFNSTAELAGSEQSAINNTSQEIITELARLNDEYFNKYGFIFIIFATGKSADQMLQTLKKRINNNRKTELKIAAEEQLKIALLRLQKMLT